MDFNKIVTQTTQYNFHSHTQFCDGRATMEEMARAAVAAGFRHYGFSPHSPVPIVSPCNMAVADVPAFIAEAERIKSMPELASCRFYTAMEIDYLGIDYGPASPYFDSFPLDYTIGSVHFIPTQQGNLVDIDGNYDSFSRRMHENFHDDIDYVVDTFFAQSRAMVAAGGFDILGHFDKIGQNASYYAPGIENSAEYQRLASELIDMVIERNLTIELNTKAYKEHGRFFPGERWLPRLIDAGVTILVNSDAHYPDRINASRNEALQLLQTLKHLNPFNNAHS